MPFIGAAIRAAKGVTDKVVLGKELKKLKEIEDKNILELVSKEKRLSAKIALKQLEHQEKLALEIPKADLENLEKEIIKLMADRIEEKKVELTNKNATQYDIANILILVQKMAYETSHDMEKIKEKSDQGLLSLNRFQDHVKSNIDMQQRDSQNRLGESLKQMKQGLEAAEGSLKRSLDKTMETHRHETQNVVSQMQESIHQTEKTIDVKLIGFKNDMEAWRNNLNNDIVNLHSSTEKLGKEMKSEIALLNSQNSKLASKMRLAFGALIATNGITLLMLVMFILGVFK